MLIKIVVEMPDSQSATKLESYLDKRGRVILHRNRIISITEAKPELTVEELTKFLRDNFEILSFEHDARVLLDKFHITRREG